MDRLRLIERDARAILGWSAQKIAASTENDIIKALSEHQMQKTKNTPKIQKPQLQTVQEEELENKEISLRTSRRENKGEPEVSSTALVVTNPPQSQQSPLHTKAMQSILSEYNTVQRNINQSFAQVMKKKRLLDDPMNDESDNAALMPAMEVAVREYKKHLQACKDISERVQAIIARKKRILQECPTPLDDASVQLRNQFDALTELYANIQQQILHVNNMDACNFSR